MLARDYTNVGRQGFILDALATKEMVGDIGSIGSDRDGAIAISAKTGNVQAWRKEDRSRLPCLGRKGRSPGEFMQPCQTALSANSTVLAVADSGNNRVQLFDASTRKLVASIGTKGQIRPGRMQTPEGVVFVEGRCEMIVADTGNSRLQVFHVDILASAHDDPEPGIHTTSISNGGGSAFEGFLPSTSIKSTPTDSTNTGSRRTTPSSKSPVARAQSEAPSLQPSKTSSGRDQQTSPPEVSAEGQRTATRSSRGETSAAGTTAGALGEAGDDSPHACLLVFSGGEGAGRPRERRTAGESEAAEGALCQPCDLAYWRARSLGGEVDGRSSALAWTPEVPLWFWSHSNHGSPGSCSPDAAHEEEARRDLLPPEFDAHTNRFPSQGEENEDEGLRSQADTAEGYDRGGVGVAKPRLGAFLVRETEVHGKLQLLFVAKTKEAEEAEEIAESEGNADPENDSDPALSDHVSEGEGSESLGWMKQGARSDALEGRRGARGTSGSEVGSSSQHSSAMPLAIFEVRSETISVLDDGRGVEISGRVYNSLLSLLRGFRWGGFGRLVSVTDSRGDRGIVAVAERAGGRVRLLHYAPPFPPFYAAELTHLHSIEGLRRPTSVSFSNDGDLLVVDQGARKVLVYSHLSGRWVRVREFGPGARNIPDKDHDDINGTDAPGESHPGRSADTHKRERGGSAHKKHPQGDPSSCRVLAVPPGECPGKERAAPGRGQEKDDAAGHAREDQDRADDESRGWDEGTPVSARFMRRKTTDLGLCTPPGEDSRGAGSAELVVVVASCDGVVRTLRGPRRHHCGSFALLDKGTALSIFELLGYRPSQVLGHVNRTMAGLRSRLRREWRLHPLTPGQLARRTLEFFQWGRSPTGEGLPGRGTSVDARGKKLCDQFLSTSSCSRPACPYSHDQPWVGEISHNSADACIVFRGGVTHAVNTLYGQVFGWEWEGELYRLFLERSFLRTMVARRDPMTLGVHGAEVVRECEEKIDRVLDYPAFVDLVTVVHEHVLGLRSWHQRPVPAVTSQPSSLHNTRANTTSRVESRERSTLLSPEGPHDNGENQPKHEDNSSDSAIMVRAQGQRPAHHGETPPGDKEHDEEEEEAGVAPAAERPSSADAARFEAETKPQQSLKGSPPSGRLHAATPWLSWDFAASDDTGTKEIQRCSSAAIAATAPTLGGDNLHYGRDAKAEPKDNGNIGHGGDGRRGREEGDDDKKRAAEEPMINRTYGGGDHDRGASVNKLFAFQTDRVVRMLDDLF